jgi:SpoVK/Ycf46/Vps4 family AAA+-type ATPase
MFEILKSRDSRKTGGAAASAPASTSAPPSTGAKPLGDGAYVKVVNGPENQTAMHKKPTLGEILNVLDGVPERYGHILVLDTNRISELDPALVRPGRVDRILSWSKLSNVATRKYIENYYDTILPKTATFPDKAYTAAELQAIVYKHKDWKSVHNEVSVKKLRGVPTIIKD